MIKSAEQKVADDTEQTICGVRITGITTGKIVDYGVRDSMNMGAAMAPAAAACIQAHLKDFSRSPSCMTKSLPGIWGCRQRNLTGSVGTEKDRHWKLSYRLRTGNL